MIKSKKESYIHIIGYFKANYKQPLIICLLLNHLPFL